jgi:hypothetical protein
LKIDAMAASGKLQLDAAVDQALRAHALAAADFAEKIGGAVFEHSGANAVFNVAPAFCLDDDGVDAL